MPPISLPEAKVAYTNGYTVCDTVRLVGKAYKVLSALVMLVAVFGGLAAGGTLGFSIFVGCLVAAAILFGMGVIIQALAETIQAVLDTAAHTRASVPLEAVEERKPTK